MLGLRVGHTSTARVLCPKLKRNLGGFIYHVFSAVVEVTA